METMFGKGINIGHQVKVMFLKTGITNKGEKWVTFTYCDQSYDYKTKKYRKVTDYNIFVNNPNDSILENNDLVTINTITGIKTNKTITDAEKSYINITLYCDVYKIGQSKKEKQKLNIQPDDYDMPASTDIDFSDNDRDDEFMNFEIDDIDFNI